MNENTIIRRKRVKHELTFEARLLDAATKARDAACKLPPGEERERLLRSAHENEAAVQMSKLMSSPRLAPTK